MEIALHWQLFKARNVGFLQDQHHLLGNDQLSVNVI
jgi:hypothetical protein